MQNAIKDLTSKIVDAQKEKATKAIKDKIGDEINNLFGGGKKEKDSTKTQQEDVKEVVKDILGGFFKKKKDN
jgi:hypothetical protein